MAPSGPDKTSKRTRDSSAEASFSPVLLNVLGYQEESEWVALALEMDIRGYGDTFAAALKEVYDLVLTQLSFAQFKGQPELIWNPAEPIWFERFNEAKQEHLTAWLQDRKPDPAYNLASLPLPSTLVLKQLGSKFVPDED
ncbi:MAG TPA: hypothetical protein VHC97_00165 [Thermoanaerobaculia bacterium]|jgi:hypothetical protein|nr:hypothetical protein [Thermoanaerobaculia bacterium]